MTPFSTAMIWFSSRHAAYRSAAEPIDANGLGKSGGELLCVHFVLSPLAVGLEAELLVDLLQLLAIGGVPGLHLGELGLAFPQLAAASEP